MGGYPWEDWIPGVLSKAQCEQLFSTGYIEGISPESREIDPSAIDLHISDEAHEMLAGSIKPSGPGYRENYLGNKSLASRLPSDGSGFFRLDRKKTYVFRIKEKLERTVELAEAHIYGQATAKSSIGRVDVLVRLIVDGMDEYESVIPERLNRSTGEMFIEVTPITFNVRVKEGISLSQLRLFYGSPDKSIVSGEELCRNVLLDGERQDATLTLNLDDADIGAGTEAAAFCAGDEFEPIDLWEENKYDPKKFWYLPPLSRSGQGQKRLMIAKDNFYILRSKEKIALPDNVAVYCRAMDEAIGEMRIHYAGFVHPFFGKDRADRKRGTPLIFEVRGHNVNVSLAHGEKMAKLTFYRMSEAAKRPKPTPYSGQDLKLSKIFKAWQE